MRLLFYEVELKKLKTLTLIRLQNHALDSAGEGGGWGTHAKPTSVQKPREPVNPKL